MGIERAYLIDSLLALGAVHVSDLDLFQRVHASVVLADGLVHRPERPLRDRDELLEVRERHPLDGRRSAAGSGRPRGRRLAALRLG